MRVGRPVVERIVAPTAVGLPVMRGERLGRIEVWTGGKLLGTRPLLAGRTISAPASEDGYGGTDRTVHNFVGFLPVIVTVTLNAAVDRTLTVPNFQLGHRHRASGSLTSGGRQGHQRLARAQACSIRR